MQQLNTLIQANIQAETRITQIDAILPQTQCEKCGYPGCKPYATAIVNGEADINQCPPGGDAGIHALAALTHLAYKPLNPKNGIEKPKALAVIDEATCIGCTLCIQACPVDAILGASKHMHTVIASECTGCELCLAPCPVDCITMQTAAEPFQDIQIAAELTRKRYYFRVSRIEHEKLERAEKYKQRKLAAKTQDSTGLNNRVSDDVNDRINNLKKSALETAFARAKQLKSLKD